MKMIGKTMKRFESFANSERYKTDVEAQEQKAQFESFANSERYKTTRDSGI